MSNEFAAKAKDFFSKRHGKPENRLSPVPDREYLRGWRSAPALFAEISGQKESTE